MLSVRIRPGESALKKLIPLLFLLAVACGKRGDPRPPVPIIPQATSDLVVTQRGSKVVLSWSYPALTTGGRTLGKIRRVVVYRYVEPLPVPDGGVDPATLLPGDVDPNLPRPVALFSRLPSLTPIQFNKLKEEVESIDGANLAGASAGAKLTYDDSPPFRTTDSRPVRVTYSVVTEAETARGDLSNLALIVPLDVPSPPQEVTASPRAEGVVVEWKAPIRSTTSPGKPDIVGYNVYRTAANESPDPFATPLNAAPIQSLTFTDVPAYGQHEYRVTAVTTPGPPRVESEPSAAVVAEFKDLIPPPPPANLTALVETKAIRLIWELGDTPDLVGYKVSRHSGKFTWFLGLASTGAYVDISATPGVPYTYSVIAFDRSNNESEPAVTPTVTIPAGP